MSSEAESEQVKASERIYPVDQIIANWRQWRTRLAKTYLDQTPKGDTFDIFVGDLHELLPKTINYDTVYASLEDMAGTRLTADVLRQVCWRIAGNLQKLSKGIPVPTWTRQPFPEWVPAQIISAKRRRSGKGEVGHVFTFQMLAGLSASTKGTKFWTDKLCRFMAGDFGFSRRRPSDRSTKLPRYQFQHPLEFVTLRMMVLIEPKLCSTTEPGFEKTKVAGANLTWNREQMKYRDRFDTGYQCPHGMTHAVPCYRCPFGTSSCRAAVHPVDYEFDYCEKCGRDRAPYDMTVSKDMCVECYDRRALVRR